MYVRGKETAIFRLCGTVPTARRDSARGHTSRIHRHLQKNIEHGTANVSRGTPQKLAAQPETISYRATPLATCDRSTR